MGGLQEQAAAQAARMAELSSQSAALQAENGELATTVSRLERQAAVRLALQGALEQLLVGPI